MTPEDPGAGESLSQEEIDALIAREGAAPDPAEPEVEAAPEPEPEASVEPEPEPDPGPEPPAGPGPALTDAERDTLGEVGNICMATAATALSAMLGHPVAITTPRVAVVSADEAREGLAWPAVLVLIDYTEGLEGRSVFVIGTGDASVVADVMMGGPGTRSEELGEIPLSAVGEAMNQMMGSASTAMAELLARRVDISAPAVEVADDAAVAAARLDLDAGGPLVRVAFDLRVGDLLDTTLMQLMPLPFARSLVDGLVTAPGASAADAGEPPPEPAPDAEAAPRLQAVPAPVAQPVSFPSLDPAPRGGAGADIGMLLDVPLQVTVELGRAQLPIRRVLELVPGSIVELDKLAGEPVDVLVNGKQIARGEVVVIDEEFGVRITEIASQAKRLRGLAEEA